MAMLCSKVARAIVPVAKRGGVACMLASPVATRPMRLRATFCVEAVSTTAPAQGQYAQQAQPAPRASDRVYNQWYVYKTRAAMCVSLVPPTWDRLSDGSKSLARDGVMLLEFASANPAPAGAAAGSTPGAINRTYDWPNKVMFALSAHELGHILNGDLLSEQRGLVLYHDPAKLGRQGEAMKRLTVKRLDDGNLNFALSAGPVNLSVPVSKGEFEVLKSLIHYAIPRILGFNEVFSS